MQIDNSTATPRRSFLGAAILLIWSEIGVVLAATIGRYVLAPIWSPPEPPDWTEIGLLEEFSVGKPVKRSVVVTQNSGWGRFNMQRLVWVVRDERSLTVFSATCPHLGCTINQTAQGFICPCHGSAWAADGRKLGGPSPRDMDALEHRLDGDLLLVRYRHFTQLASRNQSRQAAVGSGQRRAADGAPTEPRP